jgi:dTDP-glucose 4,6-dehydratase
MRSLVTSDNKEEFMQAVIQNGLSEQDADDLYEELKYEMTDFHTSRPGHDMRYALDGGLLKELGWEPKIKLSERIAEMVEWTLHNERWLSK